MGALYAFALIPGKFLYQERELQMTTKTDIYSCVETEIISMVCRNPTFLNRLKELLRNDHLGSVAREEKFSPAGLRMVEEQVRELEFRYENDSTVLIKGPKKQAIPYDCRQLGFRDHRAKGWKFFVSILQGDSNTFNFGTAYFYPDGSYKNRVKNKAYDAGWKLCNDFCKKLMQFLSREFEMRFPGGYKLYEKNPSGNSGERQFKFRIKRPMHEELAWSSQPLDERGEDHLRKRYAPLSEDKLKREVRRLNSDFSVDSMAQNIDPDQLVLAFRVGRENFGWTDEVMKDLLEQDI